MPDELNTPAVAAAMAMINSFGAAQSLAAFCRAMTWARMQAQHAIEDSDDGNERKRLFEEYSKMSLAAHGLLNLNKTVNPQLHARSGA